MSHKLYRSTVVALNQAKLGVSWRDCAENLGYPENYAVSLNRAARGLPGSMTLQAENTLRERLGLAARTRRRYHRPCMDEGMYQRWLEFRAAYATEEEYAT